jgi:hypothetical protein
MDRWVIQCCGALALLLGLGFAPGALAQEAEIGLPADVSATVDNPFFPVSDVTHRSYAGEEFDPETGETIATAVEERVVPTGDDVAGVPVTTVAVREYDDGQLTEATRDYYAQGADGTVFYLGEDVNKYEDGQLVSHDGAWLTGDGANQAGDFMPAEPLVGQRFAQEQAPGIAEDVSTVIATDLTVTTPAGTFEGCIETQDLNPLDQSVEHKWYCPGVGLVREEGAHGYSELVAYG